MMAAPTTALSPRGILSAFRRPLGAAASRTSAATASQAADPAALGESAAPEGLAADEVCLAGVQHGDVFASVGSSEPHR